MRTAGGATIAAGATAGAAQPVVASSSGGGGGGGGGGGQQVPNFGSYLEDANGFDPSGVQDVRGQDSVTINVGAGDGFSFEPTTVWVSPGTTIVWEWTGQGGGHNVMPNEGPAGFEHEDTVSESGYTYEYQVTQDDTGITTYFCQPHEGQGMKGGVAVGDGVPTVEVDSGSSGPAITIPGQALSLTTATFIAMASTLGLGYFLMKFGGDYEQ